MKVKLKKLIMRYTNMPVQLYKIIIFAIFYLIICNKSIAVSPEVIIKNRRYTTPELNDDEINTKPVIFGKTNNLRRKTGSPFIAKGQYLIINGYITDLLNIPIENAKVYIWHTNTFGYYNHLIRNKEDDLKYDIDFGESGTYITDNLGYYRFITIFPGYYDDRAPYINILIKHPLLPGDFQTKMFFPGNPRNIYDPIFLSLGPLQRSLVSPKIMLINKDNPSDGKVALFNIKIDWLHPHKTY